MLERLDSRGIFQSVLSVSAFAAPHTTLPANRPVLHKELGGETLQKGSARKKQWGSPVYEGVF